MTSRFLKRLGALALGASLLSACGGAVDAPRHPGYYGGTPYPAPVYPDGPLTPARPGFLPDRTAFLQKDPRWGQDRLGNTRGSMAAEGCVVTSVAMALGNLGFQTDPGELNRRLTETGNFTPRGWLIWNGVSEVTGGGAKAHFYDTVSDPLIQSCMRRGDYPIVRFTLPNGRTHWAMIVGRSAQGYHMRDPLRDSQSPLIFPQGVSGFEALRCIGRA